MIVQLHGKLIHKKPTQIVLDVHGVGYEVNVSMQTSYAINESEPNLTLLTHLIVREDAHTLYGFYTAKERSLFCELIKINGVGPKLALSILSSLSVNELIQVVAQNNNQAMIKIPGVGKKTAERLMIELRDKLKDDFAPESTEDTQASQGRMASRESQDAIDALIALGYKDPQARQIVARIQKPGDNSEQIIRNALKSLAAVSA